MPNIIPKNNNCFSGYRHELRARVLVGEITRRYRVGNRLQPGNGRQAKDGTGYGKEGISYVSKVDEDAFLKKGRCKVVKSIDTYGFERYCKPALRLLKISRRVCILFSAGRLTSDITGMQAE